MSGVRSVGFESFAHACDVVLVHPTSMSLVPCHDCSGDRVAVEAHEKELRLNLEFARNVLIRVVPRANQATPLPQRHHRRLVIRLECPDIHLRSSHRPAQALAPTSEGTSHRPGAACSHRPASENEPPHGRNRDSGDDSGNNRERDQRCGEQDAHRHEKRQRSDRPQHCQRQTSRPRGVGSPDRHEGAGGVNRPQHRHRNIVTPVVVGTLPAPIRIHLAPASDSLLAPTRVRLCPGTPLLHLCAQ